ncbi:thiamine diphosphokinase [Liberibacter crescens]|uniref:thiamine diphosphokinase n=1 Tax=Liberibacter crescens TaxID=1273132 RepID=UPI0007631710|nr:thiamine diphosphokinase [Liberibacter crescens]AMC13353.1 thiamine pyrophosphokinase [Liberibacter crescens]
MKSEISCNFSILLNGDLVITKRLLDFINGRRVIAVDGGIRHADTLGIIPELWIGDFDSSNDTLLERWKFIERVSYIPEKNKTDSEIAINKALEMNAKSILLIGAFSGQRFDHALQHLMLSMSLINRNIQIILTSGNEEAFILTPGKQSFDLPPGSLFSVIALSDIEGLTIFGARYLLNNFFLPFGSSRTLSNNVEKEITIMIKKGHAFLLCRPYDYLN